MSYLVIARKWRPRRFDDILGQPHITQTLSNALASGRIAHAFLFTGARGVGKTSAARILARALCCTATDRPTPDPCGACKPCIEIAEGRATDVFEIDAASNTGVANVREIIDNVRYLPASARFKIYVIDEVHMLSSGAFNALLKTLEEPPSHVKFILATTDVHKVPVTIQSRCQRYDFRRIPLGAIAERLSLILQQEGIEHDPSALSLVARESEGSMRDSQSLLEQVLAFAGERRLDGPLVREALGIVDHQMMDRAASAILDRKPAEVFDVVKDVYDRGLDLKRFGNGLVEHIRDLLVARIAPDPGKLLDRPKDEIAALIGRAKPLDPVDLERNFLELCRIVEAVGESAFPRFTLEVGLASLAEAPPRVPLQQLVDQLEKLELSIPKRDESRRAMALEPRRAELRSRAGSEPIEVESPKVPEPRPAPPPPAREPSEAVDEWERPKPREAPRPKFEPPKSVGAPTNPEAPKAHRSETPERAHPRDSSHERPASRSDREAFSVPDKPKPDRDPVPPERAEEPPEPRSVIVEAHPVSTASFGAFVDKVKKRRPTLSGSLSQVRPLVFQPGAVRLGAETKFDQQALSGAEVRSYLEEVLGEHFGRATVLEVVRIEAGEGHKRTLPMTILELDDARRRARDDDKVREARRHPVIRRLEETLGAEIVVVRPLEDAPDAGESDGEEAPIARGADSEEDA